MPAPAHPQLGASVVAIISDTHLPRGERTLPAECVSRLRAADLIIHAGDLATLAVLAELRSLGEVVAVAGNVDDAGIRAALPVSAVVTVAGCRLAVVHDAGPSTGRLARLRRRFPDADAVIFGHSHIPLHVRGSDGFQIFNPGSPTERRRSPHHTMGIAHVSDHAVAFELVTLD
jgi:putative phosphoesterase